MTCLYNNLNIVHCIALAIDDTCSVVMVFADKATLYDHVFITLDAYTSSLVRMLLGMSEAMAL